MPQTGNPSITEIYSITRIISAAELLAFAGGLIQIVPPPGDGKLIWPITSMLIYNFGTVDFSNSPQLQICYGADVEEILAANLTSLTGLGVSEFAIAVPLASGGVYGNLAGCLNQPLNLLLRVGAFALGGVGAASVGAGGTGYAIGDTGTITTGNGDATYRVLTVDGLGAVLTFAITFPGSGYATGNGQATATGGAQPGVGINFTVDVNSIVNGDGSIKVTTLYQVIDVP
jgi:hypothetical protein